MIVLFLALMTLLSVYLQISLPLSYVPVDMVFLTAVFAGLQRGRGTGFMVGAFGGPLLDALVSPTLGPRLLSLALSGALADSLSQVLNREQPRLQILAALGLSAVHDLLLFGAAHSLGIEQDSWERLSYEYFLPRMLVHALLAVPYFFVFRALVRARVFQDPLSRPPGVIRKLPH